MAYLVNMVNGVPHLVNAGSANIYDEIITLGSNITSGTPVTLPNSGTYTDKDLEVYLRGQRLSPVLDYNYVGSAPRTQVTFTFDLFTDAVSPDVIRFRVEG